MKLGEYLKRHSLTLQAFGERVGCTHTHVQRLVTGKRMPSFQLLTAIREATGGEVDAVDFLERDPLKDGTPRTRRAPRTLESA